MFFVDKDGKFINEFENIDLDELYDMFVLLMKNATRIRLLSEFSLYGFVFEIFINPDGPIKIMRQTRSDSGEQITPRRARTRKDPQLLESFCLKIVGIREPKPTDSSSIEYSSHNGKTHKKSFATFKECETELIATRYVWDLMTRYNCAEVVPDAGFGFDVGADEFGTLFTKFRTQTPQTPQTPNESHVINWIIDNYESMYLTVTEMASGCYTFSAYIDTLNKTKTLAAATDSIKNASIEIVSYFIAMWIRTGVMTTDGHSKNVMVKENPTGEFTIFLLDLGQIFICVSIEPALDIIRSRFEKIFTKFTPNMILLQTALHKYFECRANLPVQPTTFPEQLRLALTISLEREALIDELIVKFREKLVSLSELAVLSLKGTTLNRVQVKDAFISAVLCDIIINASETHNYPQCLTVLEKAFGRKFTNSSFLDYAFDSTNDNSVFDKIVLSVNNLLIPCHLDDLNPSFRTIPTVSPSSPRTPKLSSSASFSSASSPSASPRKLVSASSPSASPRKLVSASSSASSPPKLILSSASPPKSPKLVSSTSPHKVGTLKRKRSSSSSLSPDKIEYFKEHNGGSRKNRRHKKRRGVKRSHSHSNQLRRSRNEKRCSRTTRRKYRR